MRTMARMERDSRSQYWCCLWLAVGLLLACGGGVEPEPSPHMRSMADTAAAAAQGVQASDAMPVAPQSPTSLPQNRAPRFTGMQLQPAGPISAGVELRVAAHAGDPEGSPVRFQYSWTLNGERQAESGPSLDTTGFRQGDEIRVSVIATDGWQASAPMQSPILLVDNSGPIIRSEPRAAGPDGEFRYQIEALDSDAEAGELNFRLLRGPDGMQLAADTGLVVWAPSAGQAGAHPVALEVTDATGASATQRFVLQIEEPAPPAAPAP